MWNWFYITYFIMGYGVGIIFMRQWLPRGEQEVKKELIFRIPYWLLNYMVQWIWPLWRSGLRPEDHLYVVSSIEPHCVKEGSSCMKTGNGQVLRHTPKTLLKKWLWFHARRAGEKKSTCFVEYCRLALQKLVSNSRNCFQQTAFCSLKTAFATPKLLYILRKKNIFRIAFCSF